jgi:hypothetical protein
MMKYYKLFPDLPRPPQKFFDEAHRDYEDFPTDTPLHEVRIRHSVRNGQPFLASKGVRVPMSEEFNQWVRDNISEKFTDCGVNYRYCNSDTSGIHTDTTRQYALTYNILTGGPNCRIVYWQQQGQPEVRDLGIQHLNFDDCDPVFELPPGPTGVWYLHDATILHSVEGIETPRVQFTIGFNKDLLPAGWI